MTNIIIRQTSGDRKDYFFLVPADEVADILDFWEASELFDVPDLLEIGGIAGFHESVNPSDLEDWEGLGRFDRDVLSPHGLYRWLMAL